MVIRLTRCPAFEGLMVCVVDVVSKNCTSETLAQCCNARRAAPITSLPALMLAGGAYSDDENATMIGFVNQRRATNPVLSRYCSVYARAGVTAANNASNESTALNRLPGMARISSDGRAEERRVGKE